MKKLLCLTAAGVFAAGIAVAEEGAEAVKKLMKAEGYGKLAVAETSDVTIVFGHHGNAFGFVALDNATDDVIGQGKFQNGKMTGTEIIPARAHKDDGTKYGDRTQGRASGDGQGDDKSPGAGESGGQATHTRGDGAGGGVNSGTGNNSN